MKAVILWTILAVAAVPCWAGSEQTRAAGQSGAESPRSPGARSAPTPTPSRQGAPDAQTLKRIKRPAALPPTQRIPVQPGAPTPRSGSPGSSSTPMPNSAIGKNLGILEHADLAVIGPDVTETVLPTDDPAVSYTQYAHSWTVRNQGNATSHSTQLKLLCKDNYPEVGKAYCANGDHNWTNRVVEIPPLAPGATYVVHSADYGMPVVAGIKKAPPEDDPEAPAESVPHWLQFTATADPDHLVDEINRQNNTAQLLLANMSESKPSLLRATKGRIAAGSQGSGTGTVGGRRLWPSRSRARA